MRPLKSLISVDEAIKILLENISPVDRVEELNILDLNGRIAAEDIYATMNIPPFSRAAMDGYAVIAEDTYGATDDNPVKLKYIEKVLAGDVPQKQVTKGKCIEIATGAMLPGGADCVVPVEYSNRQGDNVEILRPHAPGSNISVEGVDIKKGDLVIKKGDIFNPAKIGAIAALNISKAKVYEKPKIAVIPTGKEIAPLGSELQKGQVYDINSYTITTLIKQFGAEPILHTIVPDTFNELEKSVLSALKTDLVLILGGSSVGERDINIDVIEKHGKILFHGIQMKPGKPTLAAVIHHKLILNLPGYPTSCLTNGYITVLPVIRKLARLPPTIKREIKAKLSRKIVSRLGRHQIFTVKVENGLAIPAFKESGAITSLAWADGYVEIPYNCDYLEKGDEVEVTLF